MNANANGFRAIRAVTLTRNLVLAALGAGFLMAGLSTAAQTTDPADYGDGVNEVVLSSEQVTRGRQISGQRCSECHGVTLRGALGPGLRDDEFMSTWSGRSVLTLFHTTAETMPVDAPGSLEESEYVDIITFIMSVNGFDVVENAAELQLEDLADISFD